MNVILNLSQFLFYFFYLSGLVKTQTFDCENNFGKNKYQGQCVNVNDCAGAALLGNCGNSNVCCIKVPTLTMSEDQIITKNIFLKLVGNTPRTNYIYYYFAESMMIAKIDNQYKAAAYLATLVGESDYFKEFEAKNADSDNNVELGNNAAGDGSNYRGRGAIHLRGKTNYMLAKSRIGFNLIDEPEVAAFPNVAFKVASWYWTENAYIIKDNKTLEKGNLNELADGTFLNFTHLTHTLTPDLAKLKERATFNELVLNELKYPSIKRGQGIDCKIDAGNGFAVPVCPIDFKKPYCGCEGTYEIRSCPYGLIGTKCRSSSFVKCCVEALKNHLDLAILIDSSGSIGVENFAKIKEFVIKLLSSLEIGTNATRVSIVEFNDNANEIKNFLNFGNFTNLKQSIMDINYKGTGGTNTGEALDLTNYRIMQEARGMRNITSSGISKVIIVVTDGDSDNNALTLKNSKLLKDKGFYILTVGIGNLFTNEKELVEMASTINDAYKIEEYNKILYFLTTLARSTNQKSALIQDEIEIESEVSENSYKYLTLPLKSALKAGSENITIVLENLDNSDTSLYYSFDEPNPKSDKEFIDTNDIPNSQQNKAQIIQNGNKRYYKIERPSNKNELFLSVNGLNKQNKFKISVYEYSIDVDEMTTDITITSPSTPNLPNLSKTTNKNNSNSNKTNLFLIYGFILMCISIF